MIGVAGTPSYMAPEHLSGKPVPASDIFSLGVIAYEMLDRQATVHARSSRLRCASSRNRESLGARFGMLRPQVPPEAEILIREALRFDPRTALRTLSLFAIRWLSLDTRTLRLAAPAGGDGSRPGMIIAGDQPQQGPGYFFRARAFRAPAARCSRKRTARRIRPSRAL